MIIDPRPYRQISLLPVEVTHTALGAFGEYLVARLLAEQGWRQLEHHKRGDLTMANCDGEIIDVEVKTARRGVNGHWQFCLKKAGHTDCSAADIIVLLAVLDCGKPVPFVIPQSDLTTKMLSIPKSPTNYSGRYARYRQSIDSLQLEINR